MLVLSRKRQESVMVGGSDGFERLLKVTVLEIRNGMVKLGFEGDSDVPVHRLEVWERIRARAGPERPTADPAAPAAS
jgi:carbon storage regulator CsrA